MSKQAERSTPRSLDSPEPLGGLPDGVVALADRLLDGHHLPDNRSGADNSNGATGGVTNEQLSALLFAPKQLDRDWPDPVEPVPVGGGWIHAELIDEDRPLFEALVEQYGALGPEAVAARCQEARLPVCPYRPPNAIQKTDPVPADQVEPHQQPDPVAVADSVVVDLTTHWAGPLATKLLAAAGATVIKIDPSCRPDGFGDRPFVYQHLNGDKQIIDLDLRSPAGREEFETLLQGADLLVESFSRRVMANLGYRPSELRALKPSLSTVSIKAFPAGRPEANWLAYGPGVHAAEGLATLGPTMPGSWSPQPIPAPIAYPDFLTGIAAYTSSVGLLSAALSTGLDVEVAMADVIAPLRTDEVHWKTRPSPTDSVLPTGRGADE